MTANVTKTKVMKFRLGGPAKTSNTFMYNTDTLEVTNKFTYRGITLQTTEQLPQNKEKMLSELFLEMYRLKDMHTVSIQTALKLFFYIKLSRIVEYEIVSIWERFSTTNMNKLCTRYA